MSNILASPTSSTKSNCLAAVNKIRHGSPKLSEVLRQRCRERMKERREQFYNRRRFGSLKSQDDVHNELTLIVRKEFDNLTSVDVNSAFDDPLELEEALELETEIISEQEEWILEEYYKNLQLVEEQLSQEIIFCPVCQKNGLEQISGSIICKSCDLSFPTEMTLDNFKNLIETSANLHSSQCIQRPYFSAFPFNNNIALYLTCEVCSSFSLIFGNGPI